MHRAWHSSSLREGQAEAFARSPFPLFFARARTLESLWHLDIQGMHSARRSALPKREGKKLTLRSIIRRSSSFNTGRLEHLYKDQHQSEFIQL